MRRGIFFVFSIFLTCAAGCNSYFYWPEPQPPIPKVSTATGLQIHHFKSRDDTILQGWFVPSGVDKTHGLVVHCHGSDTNVGEYYESVEFLTARGFDLFLFDYRGYGASQGKPDREGTIMDTHAAIDYAKSIPLVDKPRVALLGFSLGSGIAVVTASERSDVLGVVAEAGFDSYRRIGRKVANDKWSTWIFQFLSPILVSSNLNPIDHVAKLSPKPYFIIHGEDDELVPVSMAQNLYAQAREPKSLWIMKGSGGRHYSLPHERHPEYERRVAGYLRYILAQAEEIDPAVDPDCRPGSVIHD